MAARKKAPKEDVAATEVLDPHALEAEDRLDRALRPTSLD